MRTDEHQKHSTPAQDLVLSRLDGVRGAGGGYQALCPAHEDREPSLSVGEGRDGRVLVRCHAGCETDSVIAAIGLEYRDLFPHDGARAPRPWTPQPPKTNLGGPSPLGRKGEADPGPWLYVASYSYRDRDGLELYRKIRQASPAGGKRFRRSPAGVESSLYRLEDLTELETEILYISESEKDADRLSDLGAVAVSSGGASTWKPEWTAEIAEALPKAVVVLPHNDDAGRTFGEKVHSELERAGLVVATLNVAPTRSSTGRIRAGADPNSSTNPESPEGYDVADWIADGGTLVELDRMSDLTLCTGYSVKSDIRTEATANPCTKGIWKVKRHRTKQLLSSVPLRCHRCDNCLEHKHRSHRAKLEVLERWDRVEAVTVNTGSEHDSLTKKLYRWRESREERLLHVSVAVGDGSRIVVLTEADIGGEVIEPERLSEHLDALIEAETTALRSRLDGCPGWDLRESKTREKREPVWIDVAPTVMPYLEQVAVFERFGVRVVRPPNGKSRRRLVWDAEHLSPDEFHSLLWSLGCRQYFEPRKAA